VSKFVLQIHDGLSRLTIAHRTGKRATISTERAALFVNMHEKIVETIFPKGFGSRVSGQRARCFIPVGDSAFDIHEVHAIVQSVEKLFVE
jgi:hypothetical protein